MKNVYCLVVDALLQLDYNFKLLSGVDKLAEVG